MSHPQPPRPRRAEATVHEHGFTLVEVTIILLVLVILSTIMLPQLGNFNRLARYVVVQEDIGVLCSGMKKMLDEVQGNAFWGDPITQSVPIGLLYSDGSIPGVSAAVVAADATASNWGAPLNLTVGSALNPQVTTDGPAQVTPAQAPQQEFVADHFDNHFLTNDPLGGGESYPISLNLPRDCGPSAGTGRTTTTSRPTHGATVFSPTSSDSTPFPRATSTRLR